MDVLSFCRKKVRAWLSPYEQRILSCLQHQELDLTSLAKEMGYKGISEKLRTAVESLLRQKQIRQVTIGRKIKYTTNY